MATGIGKAGRWVARNIKTIAPIALLGASAFFTFGASLGLTAGWGAKVGGLVSKLGLTGKLGNVVAGAITQAGTGAWAGGALGAVTGGGFMSGARKGAMAGAAVGGAVGALQPVAPAAKTFNYGGHEIATQPPGAGAGGGGGLAPGDGLRGLATEAADGSSVVMPPTRELHAAVTAGQQQPSTFGRVWQGITAAGGIGPIIQGVGAGLMAAGDDAPRVRTGGYDVDYRSIPQLYHRNDDGTLSFGVQQ